MIDRGKMEMVGKFPKGAKIPGVVLQFCELCDYNETCRHLDICADLNQLLLLIRSPYAVEDAGAPAADIGCRRFPIKNLNPIPPKPPPTIRVSLSQRRRLTHCASLFRQTIRFMLRYGIEAMEKWNASAPLRP